MNVQGFKKILLKYKYKLYAIGLGNEHDLNDYRVSLYLEDVDDKTTTMITDVRDIRFIEQVLMIMSENIILEILGDIRSKMFDILEYVDDDTFKKVLDVIDEKMDKYRGKYNDDIINELMEKW